MSQPSLSSFFQDKTALVTGSTSGIGLEIADHLLSLGCQVVYTGLVPPDTPDFATEVEQRGHGRARFCPADLCEGKDLSALANFARQTFGGVDILINNAGVQHVAPVETFPLEIWNKILRLNLTAAFLLIQECLPGMRDRHFGRIVNICSAHGHVASPYKAAYVSAKHALFGLTKVVALEAAQAGVTVNAVSPGYVRTSLVVKQIPQTAIARGLTEEEVIRTVMLNQQPTKRFVQTDEIAHTVAFLCSEQAASITGSALAIDGGWTAQ